MSLGILVVLVFVAVTAGVVGVAMLLTGRTQIKREKAIQNRLQEVSGAVAATATEDGTVADTTLLRKESAGPLPNIDRVATEALKGSKAEKWLQQSGTTMTISAVVLTTLMFGVLASIAAFMFTHLAWAAMAAFFAGLGIQPLILKHNECGRDFNPTVVCDHCRKPLKAKEMS